MARKNSKSQVLTQQFFFGALVALGLALIVFLFCLQSGRLQLISLQAEQAYAGRAGLPGNNKNPDFYTTCTGADPGNPDQTPPTASISSPVDGTYVTRKQLVNFTIDSSDDVALNRNELYVNGVLKGIVYSSTAPYHQGWSVPTNATPGTIYTVYSKTCDQANNFATSQTIKLIAQ